MSKKLAYPFMAISISFGIAGCQEQTRETGAPQKEEQGSGEEENLEPAKWSYQGETGPEHWGEIAPEYSACAEGEEQSPINIDFSQTVKKDEMESIKTNYQESSFTLVNNGHTIQAEAASSNNNIVIDGEEYQLKQFHFHTPSEHLFNDQSYAMELHLVHESESGKSAVLGVMMEEGEKNDALAEFWDELPSEQTDEKSGLEYSLDASSLLPEDQTTFQYGGSLTTPPCTEGVHWIIYEEPLELSKEQIQLFEQIYSDNHRPVQPLNDRELITR
ncbi:carbonic anhydrase [Halobacillus sp. Marseille-Q1614]|uniref:carbonic anhydrase n=1 Tax=Halobacillus sp. Marseille-Q1614 TaxID=2709134 RepID=UPI00156FA886|nr:carbonic anhydrase [Halobacillus sp. Marseille-Q1614]